MSSSIRIRRVIRLLALTALVVAAVAAFAAAPAGANAGLDYVSLGDSYAAGPVIPNQIAVDTPPGCAQSDHNYAHDLSSLASFVKLTDVSCSGATTVDMTSPQTTAAGVNPPQFDALTKGTDVVTVTIGGNDIGFGSIVASCISPVPTGTPCQNLYVTSSGDLLRQRVDATAPKIDAVLDGIRARSPHARVVVVGYPDILPPNSPGCWPQMPYTPSDTAYLDGVEQYLNAMLKHEARVNHDGYGDSYAQTLGHDACQSPSVRWVEPLVPANPAAPVHPNVSGERAMAKAAFLGLFF